MITSLLVVTTALLAAGPEVTLRTLDGRKVSGQLVDISDREVKLDVGGRPESFAPARLHSLGIHEKAASSKWPVQVSLGDGSLLHGTHYTVQGSKASLVTSDGSQRQLTLKSVVSVRLREQTSELARQWNEYLAAETVSDQLVLRRKPQPVEGEAPTSESLDTMDGVIGDVTDTTIQFDVAGDLLKVKRERVDGLLYFRGREPAPEPALCVVVDIDNSRWAVRKATLASGAIKLETPSGIAAELPLERIRLIDYAAANRRYLADMPRDAVMRQTWISSEEKGSSAAFSLLSGRTPEGPISLGGQIVNQSLWMPARSALTLRVPTGFSRFQSQVGFDDRVGSTDGARLKIEADGKVLIDQLVERQSRPTPIDVELQGARRMRITVDYGGESFIGDQLVLAEAMFVK